MSQTSRICVFVLLAALPACVAQSPRHKTAISKSEPTKEQLLEYLRGALITYSPDDGINDNLQVAFDATASVLAVRQPDGYCDHFLNSLNPHSFVWELFDPSDTGKPRELVLRLTVDASAGKAARTCYDNRDQLDANIASDHARFLFSLSKTNEAPDFKEKVNSALKKLIQLSTSAPEKDKL